MTPTGRTVFDTQEGFSGGWNLQGNGLIENNQYRSPLNVRINSDGDIQPRQGTRKCTAASITGGNAITMGYSWKHPNGTVEELMVAADGSLIKAVYSDGTGQPVLSSISFPSTAGGIDNPTTVPTSMVTFRDLAGNDKVYIADGGNGISYIQGSAFNKHTVGAPGVAFRYIWLYNHRLYGIPSGGEVLYFSALDDGDSLGVIANGGGFVTIRTFGGQQLTGGIAIGPNNELFHRGAISMFRGLTTDDISIDTGSMGLSSAIGIPYPTAVALNEKVGYTITTHGAAILYGAQLQLMDLPNRPDPLLYDPAYPTGFLAAVQAAGGIPFVVRNARMKEIWFGAIGSTGFPVYVWSYRFSCWVGKFDFYSVGGAKTIRGIWETRTPSGAPQLLYGSSDGFVRTLDAAEGSTLESYKDDCAQDGTGGQSFPWSLSCRRLWNGSRRLHKAWKSVMVTARLNSGQVNVGVASPGGGGNNLIIQNPSFLSTNDYATYRIVQMPKSGQYLDIQLERDHADPHPIISAVESEGEMLGDRGV